MLIKNYFMFIVCERGIYKMLNKFFIFYQKHDLKLQIIIERIEIQTF